MAISEACQLWIEQRCKEELESQEETGKSLRAIGREIAKEIDKYFEAEVDSLTITKRASRMAQKESVTNVTQKSKTVENKEDFKTTRWQKEKCGRLVKITTETPKSKISEINKYWVCPECNETFHLPHKVAHCLHCDHHYPRSDIECSNCHNSLAEAPETELKSKMGGKREGAGRKKLKHGLCGKCRKPPFLHKRTGKKSVNNKKAGLNDPTFVVEKIIPPFLYQIVMRHA